MKFLNIQPIDLSNIDKVEFPDDQYYKEETEKTQIVLHHTVSGPNLDGILSTWKGDTQRVSTCVIIGRDGVCHQVFSSKYWAHHLGIKSEVFVNLGLTNNENRNLNLNKNSIGIELINWGGLKKVGSNFVNAYGNKVTTEVTEYKDLYKGYQYYESYSESQLNTLGSLLIHFNKKYNIPLTYNKEMFQTSLNAIRGVTGIWSHTSYRNDKSDIHPDQNMIAMLQSLN